MKLFVSVKVNAREERVEQVDETHFSVSVKTLPIEGRANKAVAQALARYLGITARRLTIRSGAAGKYKVFDCK